MTVVLMCPKCGEKRVVETLWDPVSAVREGWAACGDAFFTCPKCSRTAAQTTDTDTDTAYITLRKITEMIMKEEP